jgi:hypothetical protein
VGSADHGDVWIGLYVLTQGMAHEGGIIHHQDADGVSSLLSQ